MVLTSITVLLQMSAVVQPNDGARQREARKAQVRFESVRRANLPWDRSGGSSGRCDAQIGRYCYWYDSTESAVVPEPPQITNARTKLLGLLDSAAALNPGDEWIAGQRVRYLIEGHRADEAVQAARSCRSERWWCAALEGLALHVAERYADADSVFSVALGAMPPAQRCEWIDLRRITVGALEAELARASCEQREIIANDLWELSRPLWFLPGNDLRTEHFARHTMAAILARSANGHGMSWGGDSRELLLRYGWAEWFTRQGNDFGGIHTTPRVTGHDREPSYHFFPAVASVQRTPRLMRSSWTLREPLARTRYAPRYLERLSDLPHQLARFPRGDSMLVAVAYRIADTALAADSLAGWLCHSDRQRQPLTPGPARCARDDGKPGILSAMFSRDSIVASLEVRGERTKRAARARYTVDPLPCAASWCLSDLVLFDASGQAVMAELDSVIRGAAADLRFGNRAPLGVYWEIEGTPGSAVPVWLTLTVSPARSGVVRRIATRLKLAPELAPVRLRWQSTLRTERDAQVLTLQLPRNARGRYRVLMTLEPPGGAPISATREIELLP